MLYGRPPPMLRAKTIRINAIAAFPKAECRKLCTEPMCRLTVIFEQGAQYDDSDDTYSYLFSTVTSNVVAVVVEAGATVPQYAFYECKRLETVTVGKGATILHSAFGGCSHLLSVHLDECKYGLQSFAETEIQMLHMTPAAILSIPKRTYPMRPPFKRAIITLLLIDNGANDHNPSGIPVYWGHLTEYFHGDIGASLFCTPFQDHPTWFDCGGKAPSIVSYACHTPTGRVVAKTTHTASAYSRAEQTRFCPIDWNIGLVELSGNRHNVHIGGGVQQWIDAIIRSCLLPEAPLCDHVPWVSQCRANIVAYYSEVRECGLRAQAIAQHGPQLGDGKWVLVVPDNLKPLDEDAEDIFEDAAIKDAFYEKESVTDVTTDLLDTLVKSTTWDEQLQLHFLEEEDAGGGKRFKPGVAFADRGVCI